MGLIAQLLGLGRGVREVAEVFVPNRTQQAEFEHREHGAALEQFGREFRHQGSGFDRFVNGLNRLPRPVLALGTVGLFAYAMTDPVGFSDRMLGLDTVPRELWWLLGAIVSFYFGARELHHIRNGKRVVRGVAQRALSVPEDLSEDLDGNAALEDWRNSNR